MSTESTDRDPKELNNDWSAESDLWTTGFEVQVQTEGNEARGEVPHVNADQAVRDHLRSIQDSLPMNRWRPEKHDARRTAEFATDGVNMTVSLVADDEKVAEAFHRQDRFDTADELVGGMFDGIRDAVRDSLPDGWAQLEEFGDA